MMLLLFSGIVSIGYFTSNQFLIELEANEEVLVHLFLNQYVEVMHEPIPINVNWICYLVGLVE